MTATLHRIGQPATDDWKHQSACRGSNDPDLWFPDSYRSAEGRLQANTAKGICWTCPMRQQCLADALDREKGMAEGKRQGVWGGYTPSERWLLSRSQLLRATA